LIGSGFSIRDAELAVTSLGCQQTPWNPRPGAGF